jgi:5-methylcytosine-specific restriction endonuclease McrA
MRKADADCKGLVRRCGKQKIPEGVRQQVWLKYCGEHYKHKCLVEWCRNKMTVFNFHVGHNIPESKGGATDLTNLRPICSNCNLSMGNTYTIDEWTNKFNGPTSSKGCLKWPW